MSESADQHDQLDEHVDPPWEPPISGPEAEHLLGALDRQRATFRWKADDLDADGLAFRIGVSSLSIGGLLHHLAFVEDLYSTLRLDGSTPDDRWAEVQTEEGWEAHFHPDAAPEELYALYDASVARARERHATAIAESGLDGEVAVGVPDVGHASHRRLLFDLLEEYGRHTGQADMLREAVDGRVGEDPPDEWTTPWE